MNNNYPEEKQILRWQSRSPSYTFPSMSTYIFLSEDKHNLEL